VHAGDSTYKSPYVGSARTFRYLHCGDFRASPQHVLHPTVEGKKLDVIYLDTTYLDPKVLSTSGSRGHQRLKAGVWHSTAFRRSLSSLTHARSSRSDLLRVVR
jgi:hypothetical protein